MTNQEAIETIKANYPDERYTMLREALDMAMGLLKAQEPVKAVADGEDSYMCNNCGTVIGWAEWEPGGIEEVKYKFCPECGRAVKWDDQGHKSRPLQSRRCQFCRVHERPENQRLWELDVCQRVQFGSVGSSNWISVKDRLPETRHAVLVYTPHYKNIWAVSMHEDGNWYIWSPGSRVLLDPDWHGQITHWMPLPEPPKEET